MTNFEIESLYSDIEQKAQDIILCANEGCEKAQRVIELHRMCVRSADIPTVALLSSAFADWGNPSEPTKGNNNEKI